MDSFFKGSVSKGSDLVRIFCFEDDEWMFGCLVGSSIFIFIVDDAELFFAVVCSDEAGRHVSKCIHSFSWLDFFIQYGSVFVGGHGFT